MRTQTLPAPTARATGSPPPARMDAFFAPESVAVFGATEVPGSVGRAVLSNLVRNPFGGVLYPVSPGCPGVLGVRAYPSLGDVPAPIDLAVVAAPGPAVPGVLRECAAAGVKGAVVLAAGLGEGGPERVELRRQVAEQARDWPLRVLGPDSIGVVSSRTGINVSFAPAQVRPGAVGYVGQSGALLAALAGPEAGPGCSTFLSAGAMADLGWEDCLGYLAEEALTRSIGIAPGLIGDPAALVEAVRAVAPHKPVVVLTKGAAHGGQDAVLGEALRRAGALVVHALADLLREAELLAARPAPAGGRVAVVSNAAGPGLLAADALLAEGCETVSPHPFPSPVSAEAFAEAVAVAARDLACDAVLAVLTPQLTLDPVRAARGLAEVAAATGKLILTVCLCGVARPDVTATLERAGVPAFSCLDGAVRTFGDLWRHSSRSG